MDQTVVGLFDTFDQAQTAVQQLVDDGFARDQISLIANDANGEYAKYTTDGDKVKNAAGAGAVGGTVVGGIAGLLVGLGALTIPGIGPVLAAGPLLAVTAAGAGIGAATGSLLNGLVAAGVPNADAQFYAEGVRRGGTLVTVHTSEDKVQRASDILGNNNAVNVDQRTAQWRTSGWTGYDEKLKPYTSAELADFRTADVAITNRPVTATNVQGETVMPVVQEEINVGKREVQGGGIRVYKRVTETPVDQQVTLREEHVNIERRPVDRAATEADMNAFQDQTIEMTEKSEQAVVSKTARVIEEVVLSKNVTDRVETVHDTVRRTDVEVQKTDGSTPSSAMTTDAVRTGGTVNNFDTYASDFRTDYNTNFTNSGYTYDQYAPVYRYGYDLGTDSRYNTGDWSSVEAQARSNWEARNPNTWDQFKNAIHYAWDKARGKATTN